MNVKTEKKKKGKKDQSIKIEKPEGNDMGSS